MSPLAETLIIVAIALVLLFGIIFTFRLNKESENESFKPEEPSEEPEVKEVPTVHPTERVKVHFSTLPKPAQDGNGPSYEIITKVFE